MSARDTLLEHLSARQRAEFEETGSLLPWPFPGRIKFGIWTYGVCDADELIALKLLLEADEGAFRKQACYGPFV